jgi:hypothetical protein
MVDEAPGVGYADGCEPFADTVEKSIDAVKSFCTTAKWLAKRTKTEDD